MWFKNFIRNLRKPKEPIFLGEQVPVNQCQEFTSHKLFVEKSFSFLEYERGFTIPTSEWQSREYHTIYRSQELEVEIVFEIGMLPHVSISKGRAGVPGYSCHNIAKLDAGEDIRRLYETRSLRLKPKEERWLDRIKYDNIYDKREIKEDYERWGKLEHEQILSLYVDLIKQHPEILIGNFKGFLDKD